MPRNKRGLKRTVETTHSGALPLNEHGLPSNRGRGTTRSLAFQHPDILMEIEDASIGGVTTLACQLERPGSGLGRHSTMFFGKLPGPF